MTDEEPTMLCEGGTARFGHLRASRSSLGKDGMAIYFNINESQYFTADTVSRQHTR